MRQTLVTRGCVVTWPGQHVLSGYLLSIGIPAHSQSPGPLSLHCPGQLNSAGCISALISAVITFIAKLPLICEGGM